MCFWFEGCARCSCFRFASIVYDYFAYFITYNMPRIPTRSFLKIERIITIIFLFYSVCWCTRRPVNLHRVSNQMNEFNIELEFERLRTIFRVKMESAIQLPEIFEEKMVSVFTSSLQRDVIRNNWSHWWNEMKILQGYRFSNPLVYIFRISKIHVPRKDSIALQCTYAEVHCPLLIVTRNDPRWLTRIKIWIMKQSVGIMPLNAQIHRQIHSKTPSKRS